MLISVHNMWSANKVQTNPFVGSSTRQRILGNLSQNKTPRLLPSNEATSIRSPSLKSLDGREAIQYSFEVTQSTASPRDITFESTTMILLYKREFLTIKNEEHTTYMRKTQKDYETGPGSKKTGQKETLKTDFSDFFHFSLPFYFHL